MCFQTISTKTYMGHSNPITKIRSVTFYICVLSNSILLGLNIFWFTIFTVVQPNRHRKLVLILNNSFVFTHIRLTVNSLQPRHAWIPYQAWLPSDLLWIQHRSKRHISHYCIVTADSLVRGAATDQLRDVIISCSSAVRLPISSATSRHLITRSCHW